MDSTARSKAAQDEDYVTIAAESQSKDEEPDIGV